MSKHNKPGTTPNLIEEDMKLFIELTHVSQIMGETNNLGYADAVDKAICRISELTTSKGASRALMRATIQPWKE